MSSNFYHKKTRTTTCNVRISQKERHRQAMKRWRNNKRKKMCIKEHKNTNKHKHTNEILISPPSLPPMPQEATMSIDEPINNNVNDMNLNVEFFEETPNLQLSVTFGSVINAHTQKIETLEEEVSKYKQLYEKEVKKRKRTESKLQATEQDIFHMINEEPESNELYDNRDSEYKSKLSLSVQSCITNFGVLKNSLDSKFVAAFYDYIKIRLKTSCLKNSHSLTKLIQTMNVYNKVMNSGIPKIDLGGISDASLNRVMQFRAEQLFRTETCVVIKKKWIPFTSVGTLMHDECSQKKESQLSLVFVFNTNFGKDDRFLPKTYFGNIVRAIWHGNIPSKDSATTVQWAVKPAIDKIDELGKELYGKNWLSLRVLFKHELSVISDQNNGAKKVNRLIGVEFKVENLIKSICLMHNTTNTLLTGINRLLLERDGEDDPVLLECKNIDIVEICNSIQKLLMDKVDSCQNKGHFFKVFSSNSGNSEYYVDFVRVVGERKQFELKNVEASLSRKEEIIAFSTLKDRRSYLVSSPRKLYEFGCSIVLLRESIVVTNVTHMFSDPLMLVIGKYVQQMKNGLPVVKQTVTQCKGAGDNKKFALKTLLTATLIVIDDNIKPYIITNKMLSKKAKECIIQCIDDIDRFFDGTIFHASAFLYKVRNKLTTNNINIKDKYFRNLLFEITPTQFKKTLQQLQGFYHNIATDLKERLKDQSTKTIPDSTFTTNDRTESLNATGKYHGKRAPNIEETTKAAHAIHDFNSDLWNTFDYLMYCEPTEFQRILKIWHEHCLTYKQANENKIIRKKRYFSVKWKNIKIKLNTAQKQIPRPKNRTRKPKKKKNNYKYIICKY
eukprot:12221_1